MEENRNWIKAYIIDVLPCITAAIYILAVIYNIAFFSVFHLNIINYMSFSGMLLSILDILVIFIFASIFLLWLSLFYFTRLVPENEIIERKKKEYKNDNHKRNKFISIKFLRFLASLKQTKIVQWYTQYKKRQKEKDNEKRVKREERKKELESDKNYHSWEKFIETLIVTLFSFGAFMISRVENKNFDMTRATLFLFLPIAMYVAAMIASYAKRKDKDNIFTTGLKPIDILEIVGVYYIYAIAIFYICGIDSGNYYRNHDCANFEIKANDGELFTDSAYRYIVSMDERVFLMEKETGNNVILSNEGMTYMKINFKTEQQNSVIVNFVSGKYVKEQAHDIFK